MIFLNEIKTEPLFISSLNIENYEMHESGFGTVVFDKNGFAHHVMESTEEVRKAFKNNINMRIKFESDGIGIGDYITPAYVTIEIPKNVPSKVRPIVIFPNEDYDSVRISVSQFDRDGSYKSIEAEIKDNQTHTINLNTGVE